MQEQIQRGSKDKEILSPDELGEYLTVARPSMWISLVLIGVLILSGVYYATTAYWEVTEEVPVVVSDYIATGYLDESQYGTVETGMTILVGDVQGVVTAVSQTEDFVTGQTDSYVVYLNDFSEGDSYYEFEAYVVVDSGTYQASVVTEQYHPLSLFIS